MKAVLSNQECAEALQEYLERRGYKVIGNPQLLIGFPTYNEFRVEVEVEKAPIKDVT